MSDVEQAMSMLKHDLEYRQYPYMITAARHIGYGFNLDEEGLSREEADYILLKRIGRARDDLSSIGGYYPSESDNRRSIVLYLAYRYGVQKLYEMRSFLASLQDRNYEQAAKDLLSTELAKQNLPLFERLAYCIEFDKMYM